MRLAVVDDHANVLQRIARDVARLQHLAHPFLHRGDELPGNRPAFHCIDELESLSARQRLDLEVNLAELTSPAGLFFVPAMAFRLGANRLPEWDRWRSRVEL